MSALETALADVSTALDLAAVAQQETGLGGPTAAEIIAVVRAAVHALQGIASGAVTSDQAMAELAKLKAGLASNDAAADAALAAKFPTPTGGA